MLKKLAVVSVWALIAPALIIVSALMLTQNSSHKASFKTQQALDISQASQDNTMEAQVLGIKIEDPRPYIVSNFLKGTPLEVYSEFIVEVSDNNQIDYRLIPAIAMKESQGGATIDLASHNAWGFENGKTYFDSWESAIETVGKTLKTRYIDKGLVTPEQMMAIYAPPQLLTGGKWAKDINFFFSQMETL